MGGLLLAAGAQEHDAAEGDEAGADRGEQTDAGAGAGAGQGCAEVSAAGGDLGDLLVGGHGGLTGLGGDRHRLAVVSDVGDRGGFARGVLVGGQNHGVAGGDVAGGDLGGVVRLI